MAEPVSFTKGSTAASSGVSLGGQVSASTGGISASGMASTPSLLHPSSEMLWFLGVGGVTFGLIGLSTHARFGPFKVNASAGKD